MLLSRFLLLFPALLLLAESAGGLKWTAPKVWKQQPQRPMRAATYTVAAAPGDTDEGECAVYYFGPGQGGGVDDNIKRWTGQFDGAAKPKVTKSEVHGLKVTRIDVTGTYSGMGGPMVAAKTSKPGYRLLGAIVEAPEGAVFFKFTGPAKTVAANQAAFDTMMQSVSR